MPVTEIHVEYAKRNITGNVPMCVLFAVILPFPFILITHDLPSACILVIFPALFMNGSVERAFTMGGLYAVLILTDDPAKSCRRFASLSASYSVFISAICTASLLFLCVISGWKLSSRDMLVICSVILLVESAIWMKWNIIPRCGWRISDFVMVAPILAYSISVAFASAEAVWISFLPAILITTITVFFSHVFDVSKEKMMR